MDASKSNEEVQIPEDELLLERLEAGDNEARDILIEKNLGLVLKTAASFKYGGEGVERLISIGTVGLIKAVDTYKASTGEKLSSYASRLVENEIDAYLKDDEYKWLRDEVGRKLLEIAVEDLRPKEKEILEVRFGLKDGVERSRKEAADILGMSQSYVSRIEGRILMRLRKTLGTCKLEVYNEQV